MFTRYQYLNRECTHQEYYAQFVDNEMKRGLTAYISMERILSSKKENFSDIPLKKWDSASYIVTTIENHKRMKEAGDYLTPAGIVCILKEAARQIRDENLAYKRVVHFTNH